MSDLVQALMQNGGSPSPRPQNSGLFNALRDNPTIGDAGGAFQQTQAQTNAFGPAASPRKVYGYEVRDPFEGEHSFFRQNPHVSGMAAEDGKITLNPYSGLKQHEQDAVARNEAARLYMREKKFDFDFDPTPEQQKLFEGTAYASDPYNMRATLLARILSGDPSAGQVTPRQREWADWLLPQLKSR